MYRQYKYTTSLVNTNFFVYNLNEINNFTVKIKMKSQKTAALLIIGNEILSGRTQDKNLNYIANRLNELGIKFCEARVIPDIAEEIIEATNDLRKKYSYLFTTGGIGPTHDDITTENISKAFNVDMICHPEARKLLEEYYHDRQDDLNEARLRMANTPEGAELIPNPLTAAPGYKKDNVFVLAGVPSIMRVMFDFATKHLETGSIMHSESISCDLVEGDIAETLGKIQNEFPDTEIGSYPFTNNGTYAVSVVIRSFNEDSIKKSAEQIRELIKEKGGKEIEK